LTPFARGHAVGNLLLADGATPPPQPKTKTGTVRRDETPHEGQTPVSDGVTVDLIPPPRRRVPLVLGFAAAAVLIIAGVAAWLLGPWPPTTDKKDAVAVIDGRVVDQVAKQKDGPKIPTPPDVYEAIANTDLNTVTDYTRKEPGVPHDLLAQMPVKMLWGEKDSAHYNATRKSAQLACESRGFLFLGKVDAPDFLLRITLHHPGQIENSAVFIGYRSGEPKTPAFDSISLERVDAASPTLRVRRWAAQVDKKKLGTPRLSIQEYPEVETLPAAKGEQTLEILVEGAKITRVTLNDKALPRLAFYSNDAQTLGCFGVHQINATCTFVGASITLNPKK
jgi:hypothetical protein